MKFTGLLQRLPWRLNPYDPPSTIAAIAAGLVTGGIGVSLCLSFGVLIFSGPLTDFCQVGVTLALLSGCIASGAIAIASSNRVIAVPQETPAAILALLAILVVEDLPLDAPPSVLFINVAAAIATCTLLVGLGCWLLGKFRLGSVVRFVPYPVLGGFLAGTGWLLITGALQVIGVDLGETAQWLSPETPLWRAVPSLAFAIALLMASRRSSHWAILPGGILLGAIAFYGLLWGTGTGLEAARLGGWLLTVPDGGTFQGASLTPDTFSAIAWDSLFSHIDTLGTIVALSIIDLLLSVSSIELNIEGDLRIDHELKAVGLTNLLLAPITGLPSYHDAALSALPERFGVNHRLVGFVVAAVFAVAMLASGSLVGLIPKPLIAGILIYLGLSFLWEWLVEGYREMPRSDYGVVWLILIAIASSGFLEGIGAGLLASVAIFAFRYSRVPVAKFTCTLLERPSDVERSAAEQRVLQRGGHRIFILELQGFIFFGTAYQVVSLVRQRLEGNPIEVVVLDFRMVNGLDSSALMSFVKLRRLAANNGFRLAFSQVRPADLERLQQRGCISDDDWVCRGFPELNRALEWCEDALLAEETLSLGNNREAARELLRGGMGTDCVSLWEFLGEELRSRLMDYLQVVRLDYQELLFEQGDPPNGLYCLASGRVSVFLTLPDGSTKRLRKYTAGTILGELGLYQNAPRSASVVAECPTRLYYLSTQAFEQIEAESTVLASALHRYIVISIADRLRYRERELRLFWH
ncbi:MAG: SulP family inorganic anion transporter [Cyanophyceae cyanobacterium]